MRGNRLYYEHGWSTPDGALNMAARYRNYDAAKSQAEYDEFYASGDFRQFPRAESAFVRALVRRYDLAAGASALDVGCGTGKYAGYLAKSDLNATGIDLSPQAIRVARERFPECTFDVGNAEQLPVPEGSFDLVFSSGLSLLNEPDLSVLRPLMEHMVSRAKPGGLIVLVKTTGLTGRQAKKNTRLDHTLGALRGLLELPGVEVLDAGATYPQAFQILGRLAFRRPISAVSKLVTRVTGVPVRACVIARRLA